MTTFRLIRSRDVRSAFWRDFAFEGKPRVFRGKSQNELPADVRAAFVDYVDGLARDGTISERLAASVTL